MGAACEPETVENGQKNKKLDSGVNAYNHPLFLGHWFHIWHLFYGNWSQKKIISEFVSEKH